MQNESRANASESHTHAASSHEQHLREQIQKYLSDTPIPSPEEIKQLLSSLPASYQEMAIHTIAEQFVAAMKFRLLHMAANFYQRAEDEDIDARERDATLQDAETDICNIVSLTQRLNVDTLKNLFKLGKITASAGDLSQCDNAEEAQGWLYDLPAIYQGRLEQEHLIEKQFSAVIALPSNPIVPPPTKVSLGQTKSVTHNGGSEQWGKILPFSQHPNTIDMQAKVVLDGRKISRCS
jgi:hypothetical protein